MLESFFIYDKDTVGLFYINNLVKYILFRLFDYCKLILVCLPNMHFKIIYMYITSI